MSKTMAEQFAEAMACRNREEADAWLEQEAQALIQIPHFPAVADPQVAAKGIIRANLGYYTGYYNDPAVWEQIYELFDAEHPYFGTPAMRRTLTVEDAFAAGQLLAEQMNQRDRGHD